MFAMRMIGVGFQGISNFCGLMDMSHGFSPSTYYDLVEHIWIAAKTVASIVFRRAVEEEQQKNENAGNVKNHLTVSGDGSWARRAFSSLIGLATLIGKYSGKVLDLVVKSSVCKKCSMWKGNKDDIEFNVWYEEHQSTCDINHEGSAGLMEVNSVIEMFERSVSLHNVYYEKYVGDGDTKTFKQLKDIAPYGEDVIVKKKECVLHVKKRMYKRAKDIKTELTRMKKTKKILEERSNVGNSSKSKATASTKRKSAARKSIEKPIVKTAAFTNNIMKKLSTYYELAMRRHSDSVEEMRTAIWATFFHKFSTDEKPNHDNCPEEADSWCAYRVAEATGELDTFKHPPALDDQIQPLLKKVYEDLTTEDLLERCIGADTQNSNEAFNSCVWHLVPKNMFAGKKIVEIASYCAACTFNEGFQPLLKVMETMGVTIGRNAAELAKLRDRNRIQAANRQSLNSSKERRTELRNMQSGQNDYYDEQEGIMYGAGIAN